MSRAVENNDVAKELWEALSDATALGSGTKTALLGTLGLDTDLATFSLPASTTISTFGASLVDDADASAARTTLGLAIGTDVAAQNDTRIEPQVKSSNFTAANGETYHVVASVNVTDPSPVEGKGYVILVRNGTCTIAATATAYSTAGTVIIRTFHSGAWASYVYQLASTFLAAANNLSDLTSASTARTNLGLGTAATESASSFETPAGAAAQISAANAAKNSVNNQPLQVACVGTSITAQSSNLLTDANPRLRDMGGGHAGWLEHLSNHRVRLVHKNGVFETELSKVFGYSGYTLVGLTDGSGGRYPLDNAIASRPDVFVLEGGTNDIAGNTSATVISRITAYWTKARATGLPVIALNVLPTGSAAGATNRDTITTVNAALPALATSLGVTLIDTHSIATKDGSGYATTETLWDGVHPTPAYAHRLAVLINAQLSTYYTTRRHALTVPNQSSALWLTNDNSPSAGSKSAWWVKTGTFTDTYTAVTDADGTTWQRIRMVQGGAANAVNGYYTIATTGYTAGDRIRFACRLRAVTGSADDFLDLEIYGRSFDTGAKFYPAVVQGSNRGTGNFDPVTGLFVSPVFVIPSGTGQVTANIDFYGNDVTFDIRQFGIYKTLD